MVDGFRQPDFRFVAPPPPAAPRYPRRACRRLTKGESRGLQRIRFQPVVAVQPGDQFARSSAHSFIDGMTLSFVRFAVPWLYDGVTILIAGQGEPSGVTSGVFALTSFQGQPLLGCGGEGISDNSGQGMGRF